MKILIQQAVLDSSSNAIVNAGASRVGLSMNSWPYVCQISTLVDALLGISSKDANSKVPLLNLDSHADELSDYLALATCGHMFDGWRYLSQAAISLLNGSRSHALHLAYYAELRAAMSILARSGIGILNQVHYVVNNSGSVDWFVGPTHKIVWDALDIWSSQPSNAIDVINCFEAFNVSARDWANACNITPSFSSIAEEWLKAWAADIKSYRDDRTIRNKASYRPDFDSHAFDQLTYDEIRFILSISAGCGFLGNGRFDDIDAVLIQDLCIKAYELLNPLSAVSPIPLKYWEDISDRLMAQGQIDGQMARNVVDRLSTTTAFNARILIENAQPSKLDAVAVISRAFLLLRLSSALVRKQWHEIRRYRSSANSFDWQAAAMAAYGAWSNLWDPTDTQPDYYMLDEDRVDAEDEIQEYFKENQNINPYKIWAKIPGSLLSLCRFERVGLLAVAP